MKAIKLSHYKRKLMDISRELYRTHDWDMPDGFRDEDTREPLNYSRQEAGQAKRAKLDPKAQKEIFRKCWDRSDSRSALAAALWEEGYLLARGDRRGFVAVDADGKIWSLSRWCGVKPKNLRARLGSEGTHWSVAQAKDAFRELGERPTKQRSQKPDPEFDRRREALVARQRQERAKLRDVQEARRITQIRARQARLPYGIKSVWARMTGQYQTLLSELSTEAATSANRDRDEEQSLVNQHLAERGALDQEFAQPDILAELKSVFETNAQADPRQYLVLPPDDIPFTTQELLEQPELILDHISHKNARFNRTDILHELAKRIPDPMALRTASDKALRSVDLVKLGNDDTSDLTTKDYLASENDLGTCASILSRQGGFAVRPTYIAHAIHAQNTEMHQRFGGQLSAEQQAALNHILGDSQLSALAAMVGHG